MSTCDSASVLCQGSDTSTRNIATWAETCCLSVCGKSGWALGLIDLVCVDGLLFLKDDVLDADPGRSRGFEGKATFYSLLHLKLLSFFSNLLLPIYPGGGIFMWQWSFTAVTSVAHSREFAHPLYSTCRPITHVTALHGVWFPASVHTMIGIFAGLPQSNHPLHPISAEAVHKSLFFVLFYFSPIHIGFTIFPLLLQHFMDCCA